MSDYRGYRDVRRYGRECGQWGHHRWSSRSRDDRRAEPLAALRDCGSGSRDEKRYADDRCQCTSDRSRRHKLSEDSALCARAAPRGETSAGSDCCRALSGRNSVAGKQGQPCSEQEQRRWFRDLDLSDGVGRAGYPEYDLNPVAAIETYDDADAVAQSILALRHELKTLLHH